MDAALLDLLRQTVTIEPYTGPDPFGAPGYGPPVEYPARVRREAKMVRASDGEERVSSTVVWLDGAAQVGPQDRITMPDGSHPPILAVESSPDETGETYVVKVRCE